nr:MAG TPA: hypothetical protein [Caudoviricetes sp.]
MKITNCPEAYLFTPGAFALLGGFYICPYVSFAPTRVATR